MGEWRGRVPEGEISMLASVTMSLIDSTIFLRIAPSKSLASNIVLGVFLRILIILIRKCGILYSPSLPQTLSLVQ
jgi:hypothetical protein